MTFDPFQLVPTSTEVSPFNLTPPTGEFTSLLPKLPPSNYQTTEEGVKVQPSVSLQDLLGLAAKQTIAPTYEYTFEQEKRFSNPYLQFNPKPLGGYDTEDIYAKFQGSGEQLWNALVKTGATGLSSFISSFSSLGSSIDALRGGQPFDEDSYLGQTQGWLRELENKYPNYYSQWEREHPFLSAITPSGMANFWGDKVLKNVGFTVGSLASSFLVDAGLNLATGGAATPTTFVLAANQLRRAVAPLKNAFRSLAKTSTLNKVDDLAGISRVGVGINEGLKNLNSVYNFKKGLQFAGTTYFAAQGEAMIEGYLNYYDTKAKLYKQELEKGNISPDKLIEIEEIAQEAANITTALNLPIIAASNLIQFPTIFGGRSLLKRFDSPFLDVVNKEGLTVVNNYSKKQAWVNTMKELVKDFATEGGEEGYQYYVGNSIHDYYVDKFNDKASSSLSSYLAKQFPDTLKNEEFWESFMIGGIAGGLMGSYHTIKKNLVGANARTEQAVATLQPIYDRFNSTVKDLVHLNENIEHEVDEDKVNQFQSAHKALFSTVHDSLKYGVFDNFQDSIEDLRNLPVEEYNKLFETEFNEQEKLNHLNKIQKESFKIKDELTQVNKFFQTNPFDSPYVNQRLRDIYKIDQTQIENVKVKLFEDYKELVTYNISRLRNTRGRIEDIEDELKMMGIEDPIIPTLYNLDSQRGVTEYKKLKQIQLDALKSEQDYYKELETPKPELNLRVKNIEKLLTKLNQLDAEELTDTQKKQFRSLVFNEELGNKQLVREEDFFNKQQELKKEQDIAINTAEDLEKQTNKPEEKVKEQIETLSKIVPPETVDVPEPVQPDRETIFNKNFENLNEGDTFSIELDSEKGVFTLISKSPLIVEKGGIRYQFLPDRVIKFDEGEQALKYASDNIGVQKVRSEPLPIEEIKGNSIIDKRKEVAEIVSPGEWDYADTPSVKVMSIMTGKLQRRADLTANATIIDVNPIVPLDTLEDLLNNKVISQVEYDTVLDKLFKPKAELVKKPKKETITKQQKLKEAVDKKKDKPEKPVKDGIYLIDRDYSHAWRYVDENTAVPLKLSLKENEVVYKGDMTKGVEKKITEGYLLDNQYIQAVPETKIEETVIGEQLEMLEPEILKDVEKDISLPKDNLTKFLNNEPIPDILRQVLEWRSGKGLTIDC